MNTRTLALVAIGAGAWFAFRWIQHQQFKASLGGAYDSLMALQPRITAPVIRVAPPTLSL